MREASSSRSPAGRTRGGTGHRPGRRRDERQCWILARIAEVAAHRFKIQRRSARSTGPCRRIACNGASETEQGEAAAADRVHSAAIRSGLDRVSGLSAAEHRRRRAGVPWPLLSPAAIQVDWQRT